MDNIRLAHQNNMHNVDLENLKNINDIYKYVKSNYNEGMFKKIQSVTKLSKKVSVELLHKKFLLNCRKYDLTPKHIFNVLKNFKSFMFTVFL